MALTFPKINQIRFENVDNAFSTVNPSTYNMDNRSPDLAINQGVYPHRFYQPIPKSWNGIIGDGNELDFMIIGSLADWATEGYDCKIYSVTFDQYSNVDVATYVETLTPALFYTYADSRKVYRFTKSLGSYTAGFYIVKIISNTGMSTGEVYYQSNVLQIDTHANFGECYTFSGSNFENDFGVIWVNTVPTTWYLKILIPCRMYKPVPKIEKNVYQNDSGLQTTLRSNINRVYEFESMPIPMWYGELFIMSTALSLNYINRIAVNFEQAPDLTPIQDSNLCVVKGNAVLTEFNNNYYLNI